MTIEDVPFASRYNYGAYFEKALLTAFGGDQDDVNKVSELSFVLHVALSLALAYGSGIGIGLGIAMLTGALLPA